MANRWALVRYIGPDGAVLREWLTGEGRPDLSVIEDLARRQQIARRAGGHIRLSLVCPDLADLLAFTGVGAEAGLAEVEWEAEGGEDPLGL